jgi:O-antigen/teichoic acid export membrane protein
VTNLSKNEITVSTRIIATDHNTVKDVLGSELPKVVISHRRLIAKNFIALSLGSTVENFVTLFSSIYIRRVLGVIAIGQVSWTASMISYFGLLVNPGFQFIAKREVAREPQKGGQYLMLLTLLQLILATLSFGLAVIFSFVLPGASEVRLLIILQAVGLFLIALDPSWILQAREHITPLTIASVISSVLQALCLLLLVHEPAHVLRYVLIAYPFRLGLYAFIIYYGTRHQLINWNSMRPTLVNGWNLALTAFPIGLSQLAALIYYNSDTVFLGFISGAKVVGLYSTAYSLMLAPLILARALSNAYFPSLSRATNNPEEARRVSGEYLSAMTWMGFPIAFLGWAVGRNIIVLLFGEQFAQAGLLFEWLSFNIALIFFNIGLVEPLIAWNGQKNALKCTISGAITNLLANFILIPRFGPFGAVAASILAELVVMGAAINVRRHFYPTAWLRPFFLVFIISIPTALFVRWLTMQTWWFLAAIIGLAIYCSAVFFFERQNFFLIYHHLMKRDRAKI